MDKLFEGFNHGTGKIKLGLTPSPNVHYGRPIEVHLKEDGTINNEPSLAFVLHRPPMFYAIGEISVEMLNQGLKDIGYEIKKIDK